MDKNVTLHNLDSMKSLAYEFKSSSLLLHPNIYHETFGMVYTQAQAAGCLPVTTRKGSACELIQNGYNGFLTDSYNIENIDTFNQFVDIVCNCLESDLYSVRLNAINNSSKWDYPNLAKKLLDIIGEN